MAGPMPAMLAVEHPGAAGGAAVARPARVGRTPSTELADLATAELPRLQTGMGELDRVLGGGLIPGSVTLLGGTILN